MVAHSAITHSIMGLAAGRGIGMGSVGNVVRDDNPSTHPRPRWDRVGNLVLVRNPITRRPVAPRWAWRSPDGTVWAISYLCETPSTHRLPSPSGTRSPHPGWAPVESRATFVMARRPARDLAWSGSCGMHAVKQASAADEGQHAHRQGGQSRGLLEAISAQAPTHTSTVSA